MTDKRLMIIAGVLVALIAVIFIFLVETIPPRSLTSGAMHMTKRRILRYAHTHDSLPSSLDQLPTIDGYSNRTVDGWGREIQMNVEAHQITFLSLGKDGIEGGTGDNADMVGIFAVKDADGEWNDELVKWTHVPHWPIQ